MKKGTLAVRPRPQVRAAHRRPLAPNRRRMPAQELPESATVRVVANAADGWRNSSAYSSSSPVSTVFTFWMVTGVP